MTTAQVKRFAHKHRVPIVIGVSGVVLVGVLSYAFVRISELDARVAMLSENLASTTEALSGNLSGLRSETMDLSHTLANTKSEVATVTNNVAAVTNKVGGVEQTVGSISGTVSTLQKLSTIDPELLKKYSKVFFLNENYTPAHLTTIPQDEVYSNTREEQFLSEAFPFLQNMLAAARNAGVTFYVKSAYRSFGTQEALKANYVVRYGEGTANAFSADQGYSEHQLGTTVDFVAPGFDGNLTIGFDGTNAYQWLTQNAYKFGFELSYPKNNSYYMYEPWHWRFVGIKLATYLHDNNENFYNMDQRDIDTYLANLFDQ